MNTFFKNKKNLLIIALAVLLLAIAFLIFRAFRGGISLNGNNNQKTFQGKVILDQVKVPDTSKVSANSGEDIPKGEYNVKLQPKSEQDIVVITNAKLTLKDSYNLAVVNVANWASDQKLVFIKSNGAIGLDGKASSWQLVFNSAKKKKNYEVIIVEDKIFSEKEISSNAKGYDLPNNWYDDYDAIATFRNLPQFSEDTMSSISFYYDMSAKSWAYGLATDNNTKVTAMWVK